MKRGILLFLFLLPFHPASAQDPADSMFTKVVIDSSMDRYFQNPSSVNLWMRSYTFSGAGLDTVYKLPDAPIAIESETVLAGQMRLYRGSDYEIMYRSGEIRFFRSSRKTSGSRCITN